eukprot:4764823-Pleurochrysis_carterae.AAC.1
MRACARERLHERVRVSSACARASCSKKHQHQYLPYSVGFSGCESVVSVHVLPPSSETSTRITCDREAGEEGAARVR